MKTGFLLFGTITVLSVLMKMILGLQIGQYRYHYQQPKSSRNSLPFWMDQNQSIKNYTAHSTQNHVQKNATLHCKTVNSYIKCANEPERLQSVDYLAQIKGLHIQQKSTQLGNQYQIYDLSGNTLWYAEEESFLWNAVFRLHSDHTRPFEIILKDWKRERAIQITRPSTFFPWDAKNVVKVYSPPGTLVGTVEATKSFWFPRFNVKNAKGEIILQIKADRGCFLCSLFQVFVEYNIVSPLRSSSDEIEIGFIANQWSGFVQEFITEADNFSIRFPTSLDVNAKALLIAGCILIDFMYFENTISKTYSDKK